MPLAPTGWRWVISIWGWDSGRCCRWRRWWPRQQAPCLVFRCCACTATIWLLWPLVLVKSSVWSLTTGSALPAARTGFPHRRRPSLASNLGGGRKRAVYRSTSFSISPITLTWSLFLSTRFWCWWYCWCCISNIVWRVCRLAARGRRYVKMKSPADRWAWIMCWWSCRPLPSAHRPPELPACSSLPTRGSSIPLHLPSLNRRWFSPSWCWAGWARPSVWCWRRLYWPSPPSYCAVLPSIVCCCLGYWWWWWWFGGHGGWFALIAADLRCVKEWRHEPGCDFKRWASDDAFWRY